MLQPGQKIECEITDIAFGGAGIARIDGLVVFVPFTIQGERVMALVTEKKKDYAIAQPVEILAPSLKRVNPPCRYFSVCQGCAYQHMDYREEAEVKKRQVIDVFTRIGGFVSPPVLETAACPSEYFYRNKVRLRYKKLKDRSIFGYIIEERRRTLDIENCAIASQLLNAEIRRMREDNFAFFESRGIRGYNLVLAEDGQNVHTPLEGDPVMEVEVSGKTFRYSLNSFFQVNRSIFSPLLEYLSSFFSKPDARRKSLCDLYCGVGFFGILLGSHFEQVDFIEQNKVSCRFLQENIALNQVKNARVLIGDAGSVLSASAGRYDAVIIDPPRPGCSEDVCLSLASIKPSKLIYISCHPATMARDIRRLCGLGFRLASVKPFDFFPKTKHIECVAELSFEKSV
jgi:23S rRNA (uracil1939-C5)-methyltransferase